MNELMSTKDLAKYLKLHAITICKYANEGVIPGIRIGRMWRFRKDAIDAWLGRINVTDGDGPNELQTEHAKKDDE